MMTLLAKSLSWLVGSNLLVPAALLAALTLGHSWWLERDSRLRDQGKQTCEAEHELVLARAQLKKARHAAEQAVKDIESEKQLTETLRHDAQAIRDEFEAHKARASTDPKCLSPGVLELLRGNVPVGKR